jgi:hypothetical protein
VGTESSSGSTESSPPAPSEGASQTATPPASSGWVPQGEGTEASSQGAASTRRGSSLGSAAGPKPAGSTGRQPGSTSSEESSYSGGSSGYYEPELSTPSTSEAPAPQAVTNIAPVEPPSAAEAGPVKGAHADVGAATPVASSESSQPGGTSSVSRAASLVPSTPERVASGSGSLPLPILIVCVLILVYAGGRLLLGPVIPQFLRDGPFARARRVLSRV